MTVEGAEWGIEAPALDSQLTRIKHYEKVLRADADMNKANWLAALAAILGILGVGMGWWWADSAAAAAISLEIIRDGFTNLKNAVMELIDHRPLGMDKKKKDKTQERLQYELEQLDWVERASVRLRELGNLFTGEAYVVPKNQNNLLSKLQQASDLVTHIDWRLYDVVIVPVPSLKPEQAHGGNEQPSGIHV